MERYLSAAQKISRLAIGSTVRAPQTYVMTLPVDLTQEQHFADLPLGTRGGTVFPYTFPVDGEYEIQVRLYRDRDEHVEGLGRQGRGEDSVSQKHELELTLDGKQVTIFTVAPPTSRSSDDPRDYDDSVYRQGLQRPRPRQSRPARDRRDLPEEADGGARNGSAAVSGRVQHGPASATCSPQYSRSLMTGPFEPTGAG